MFDQSKSHISIAVKTLFTGRLPAENQTNKQTNKKTIWQQNDDNETHQDAPP